ETSPDPSEALRPAHAARAPAPPRGDARGEPRMPPGPPPGASALEPRARRARHPNGRPSPAGGVQWWSATPDGRGKKAGHGGDGGVTRIGGGRADRLTASRARVSLCLFSGGTIIDHIPADKLTLR